MKVSLAVWLSFMAVLFPLSAEPPVISEIHIQGTINPTTTNYIERAIQLSVDAESICLIIQLDTPREG